MTSGGGDATEQRDWSGLPGGLLHTIMHRLAILADVIRFQAVCKLWRQAVVVHDEQQQKASKFRQSLPWLMCRHLDSTRSHGDNCRLFLDVSKPDKIRHFDLAQAVPPGSPSSTSGWLIVRRCDNRSLLEPFSGNRISLPPFTPAPGYVSHYAMSAEPTAAAGEGCFFMVSHADRNGGGLAFCKLGGEQQQQQQQQQRWTPLLTSKSMDASTIISNIVFWRNQFYASYWDGTIVVCDLTTANDNQSTIQVSRTFLPKNFSDTTTRRPSGRLTTAVSPEGELMLVAEDGPDRDDTHKSYEEWLFNYYHTTTFTVYKLN